MLGTFDSRDGRRTGLVMACGGEKTMVDGWDWMWALLIVGAFWGGFVAVIVAVLSVAARAFAEEAQDRAEKWTPDAGTILQSRFASGEISRQEFEERTRMLQSRAA